MGNSEYFFAVCFYNAAKELHAQSITYSPVFEVVRKFFEQGKQFLWVLLSRFFHDLDGNDFFFQGARFPEFAGQVEGTSLILLDQEVENRSFYTVYFLFARHHFKKELIVA